MLVQVIKEFRDTENGMKLRTPKDKPFEVSKERAARLVNTGFAKIISETKEKPTKTKEGGDPDISR